MSDSPATVTQQAPASVAATPGRPRAQPEHLLTISPWRAIIRLAMPTTLVMLIAATSNVLYTYYVSRLGPDAIAAVSLVFPISLLAITAMAGGIGAGASSAVARALGAGRRQQAALVAEHALLLSVGAGVVFALTILIGAPTFFGWMGGSGAVLESATLFARVLFSGAAIQFTAAMFDSIMRGEGNVRTPSLWSSASLLLQILLTPLFMFGLGWGLPGAAVAVLTSQFLGSIPRARYVFGGRGIVHPRPRLRGFTLGPLADILRVGIPASLSTIISYLGMMVLTGVVARLGTAHLAAYGLGTRFDFLLLSFAFGFGAAVLTLVGLSTGARQPERASLYVVRAGAIIVGLLAVAAVILWWRPTLWLHIFTHDADIEAVGTQYFRIIGPSYPFMGVAMVLSFAFQGLGRATAPLVWVIVRVVGVLTVALVCTQRFGLADRAVFTTVAAGNVVSAVVMTVLFLRAHGRLKT